MVFMWSTSKSKKLDRNSGTNQKKNPLFSRENSGFLVRVTGFGPMAPRADTLRAIRRRISMQEAAGSTNSHKTKNTADIASTVFFGPSDRI